MKLKLILAGFTLIALTTVSLSVDAKPVFNKFSYLNEHNDKAYCINLMHTEAKGRGSDLKPIVCVVQMQAKISPARKTDDDQFPTAELLAELQPDKLMKLCFDFKGTIKPGEKVTAKHSHTTFCTDADKAEKTFQFDRNRDLVTLQNNRTLKLQPSKIQQLPPAAEEK